MRSRIDNLQPELQVSLSGRERPVHRGIGRAPPSALLQSSNLRLQPGRCHGPNEKHHVRTWRHPMSVMTRSLTTVTGTGEVRLLPRAVAVPALASHIRPGLVLAERETRLLLAKAGQYDVCCGGCFSAGPAGVQVWDRPFDGR